MLIFGASVGDWQEKAAYAKDKADNDFAAIREIRCEGIKDVDTAFAAMAAFAADSKCKKFLYHATINLSPGERLTPKQWREAVDLLEKNLNLPGHHRVVFEHIKKNRQHYHIVWSRLPPGGGAAVNMGHDYAKCERTALALEKKFGLKPAQRKGLRGHRRWEAERGKRSGIDPASMTKEVTAIYHASKTAKEFVAALDKAGYVLSIGNKNGSYVLVDKKGDIHGLLRRIEGIKLADLKRKFPDLKNIELRPLANVLKERRPSKKPRKIHRAFRRGSYSFAIPPRIAMRRIVPKALAFKPRPSLAALIARIRVQIQRISRSGSKPNNFYYPMRRRKKRKRDQNVPDSEKMPFRRPEWETAELLAWAFENGRGDVLKDFGININPEPEPEP